ncbi:fumarylacetoacetase [uncultured Sphingomonas sp.]|uniref:fumarylacetoacetase n=1 Tax=uncultured Sphingomonas sp. TaxID=158754 RepID=UPI0035CBA379
MSDAIDETHDSALRSWVPGADEHPDFPVQNLPFGIFSPPGEGPRGGVAIGDRILDLAALGGAVPVTEVAEALRAAAGPTLNPLLARPPGDRRALRRFLSAILSDLPNRAAVEPLLYAADACSLHLPARIGDYTDFYVGIHHATNVGRLFRPDTPLLPNYKHVPIGYHGRSSSVRLSGTPVPRPNGQRKAADADAPEFGPTRRLDLELELGLWIGGDNALGTAVAIDAAGDRIAGLCLLNDWSARDVQAWEYQPLGPFLAKSFLTTISPWVVTAEALAPFRTAQAARPAGDPAPLPYLWSDEDQARGAFAITLDVQIDTARMRADGVPPVRISRSAARHMYWTAAQLVTHHASNGCDLHGGDLFGSGTISTPDASGLGSLLELTQSGTRPIDLPGGETRTFLEDGDRITLSGRAAAPGFRSIGFGSCVGLVTPGPETIET